MAKIDRTAFEGNSLLFSTDNIPKMCKISPRPATYFQKNSFRKSCFCKKIHIKFTTQQRRCAKSFFTFTPHNGCDFSRFFDKKATKKRPCVFAEALFLTCFILFYQAPDRQLPVRKQSLYPCHSTCIRQVAHQKGSFLPLPPTPYSADTAADFPRY